MKYQQNFYLGIAFMILAEFFFTSMAAIIKWLSVYLPNESIVFFRNFLSLLILWPWIVFFNPIEINVQKYRFHLVRSLAGLAAMYCFYYAWANLPLAEVSVLKMTVPFFLPVISFWWLGECISKRTKWAIVIGFFGIIVILKPSFASFSFIAIIALMGSLFSALAKTAIRRMSDTESSIHIVFIFAFVGTWFSAIPLLWAWVTPDWQAWGLLGLLVVFSVTAQLLMTQAYQRAPVAQIGPFSYVSVIFAVLFGWFFWNEPIDFWFIIGTGLIIAAGILITYSHLMDKAVKMENGFKHEPRKSVHHITSSKR
jgi:drug/metabolite transporter (DMT)-like permease